MEQIRDDVWSVGIKMPGGHIPYSLLYLVRDSQNGVHVVDPGWDSADNWKALEVALATIDADARDIRSITATHLHPDHIGMARRLQDVSGAPLQVHVAEREALDTAGEGGWSPVVLEHQLEDWDVPTSRHAEFEQMQRAAPDLAGVTIDRVVVDGDRLDVPGLDLFAMHTPGHTPGHLSIRDDARSFILTGDHVLPTMHGGLGLGGLTEANPLADYLASLEAVAQFPNHEALPGHGYRFTGIVERASQSAAHHLRRSREVAAVLDETPDSSIWAIASRLTWTAGWENLVGFFAYSAMSQTAIHKAFVVSGRLDHFTALFEV